MRSESSSKPRIPCLNHHPRFKNDPTETFTSHTRSSVSYTAGQEGWRSSQIASGSANVGGDDRKEEAEPSFRGWARELARRPDDERSSWPHTQPLMGGGFAPPLLLRDEIIGDWESAKPQFSAEMKRFSVAE